MPGFSTEVPHSLGQEEAQQKLESFLQKIIERYKDQVSDISGNWSENVLDFSMTTYGISIRGKLNVEEDKVKMDGELPFAAMMFKGKITKEIEEALQKALA